MLDRLNELRSEFGCFEQRLLSYQYEGENGSLKMNEIMESLRQPLSSFKDNTLRNAERIDYLRDDTGFPKSDVLSFSWQDHNRIIVRPSGTEPKLKVYLFTRAENEKDAQRQLDNLQDMIDQKCIK